jgi:hypothetical protein
MNERNESSNKGPGGRGASSVVCRRMPTYADVNMLTNADVCQRMLTYEALSY